MAGIDDLAQSFVAFGIAATQNRAMAAAMRLAEGQDQAQRILAAGLVESGQRVEAAASRVVRAGLGENIDRLV